ncbi:MAG: T9SS type A sorting domain-containing protein [bacterium]
MKKYMIVFFCFLFVGIFGQNNKTDSNKIAGFRASRILQSYPNNQFPVPNYWANAGHFISGKFTGAAPASIWIVSLYIDNGQTQLNFPNPGGSYPYISFINSDQNEVYLNRFDQEGIKVWLQVEPGAASIDTLIHIVLNKYKHHSCVVGFGVDVEWFNAQSSSGGRKVTNAEAERWEQKVKSFNPNYTLFLKHYGQAWMPPTYRGDILFVDDSQQFSSLNSMINEFTLWGNKFKPNKVAFQFGYSIDKPWWSVLNDPIKTIGNSLFTGITNCYGVFWVDFTIEVVFPLSDVEETLVLPDDFIVYQNYPNPFNPSTKIKFSIPNNGFVTGIVYNLQGEEISVIVNEYLANGSHEINFSGTGLSSGIYLVKINYYGNNEQYNKSIKIMLLK